MALTPSSRALRFTGCILAGRLALMASSSASGPKGSLPAAHRAASRATLPAWTAPASRPSVWLGRKYASEVQAAHRLLHVFDSRAFLFPHGHGQGRHELGGREHQPALLQVGQGAQGLHGLEPEQDVRFTVADLG